MTKYFILENAAVLELDQGAYTLVTVTGKRSPFDDIYLAETATFEVTSKEAAAFLARAQAIVAQRHFIYRDCGTGAGGFKTGNECSKSTGQGVHEVEVKELNASPFETVSAKRDFINDAHSELQSLGCQESRDVDCEDGFNGSDVQLTDSQKECLFLYSGEANADLLKSPTYKWVEPAEDNDIGYKDETIEFLRDTGRIDGDLDYDGTPLDEDKFNIIQDGIHAINDEIMSAASTTDLNLPKGFELYRGMSVKDVDAEQFLTEISKDGATLDTENVSSWSKDGSIAGSFLRQTKVGEKVPIVMFGTKFTNGIDMAQQETALHADESEIVVPPSRFYVKRVEYQRTNKGGKLVGIRVHVEGLAD